MTISRPFQLHVPPSAAILIALLLFTAGRVEASRTSTPTSYPLAICSVSGDALVAGKTVTREYNGREVRFCSKMCGASFEKDTASALAQLDAAIIEAQLPNYPTETCVVSGDALDGDEADPVNLIVDNRLLRLCSQSCAEKVGGKAVAYIETLDQAVVAAQVGRYPAETCPISGQKLGSMGDPYDYVYAGHLVRFCCGGCIDSFNEDPQAAMLSIYGEDAGIGNHSAPDGSSHDADAHDHSAHEDTHHGGHH